jgi:hypothetical protein
MDTREFYAQHAVEVRARIAANAAPRNVLEPTTFPSGSLYMQTYRAPHNMEEHTACVAETAYFIAMRRGFSPAHELEDWLAAENEVDARLIGAPREY